MNSNRVFKRHRAARVTIFAFISWANLGEAGTAHAACPESSVCCQGASYPSVAPRNRCEVREGEFGSIGAVATYDLPLGLIEAWGYGGDGCCISSVIATDEFQLQGPNGSAPLKFSALLTAFGYAYGGYNPGYVAAKLREGLDNEMSVPPMPYLSTVLSIALEKQAGETFRILYSVEGVGGFPSGFYSAQGRLSFADLPQGTYVTSCQGYRQDFPVRTLPTSWGRIKATYR